MLNSAGLQARPPVCEGLPDWWAEARLRLQKDLRRGFDSLVILVVWHIWKERNFCVFESKAANSQAIIQKMLVEGAQWALTGARVIARPSL